MSPAVLLLLRLARVGWMQMMYYSLMTYLLMPCLLPAPPPPSPVASRPRSPPRWPEAGREGVDPGSPGLEVLGPRSALPRREWRVYVASADRRPPVLRPAHPLLFPPFLLRSVLGP